MLDDCGELMDKYFDSWSKKTFIERAEPFLVHIPQFTGEYKPYTRVCPWCRTNQTKVTCVNCGAPQTLKGN